MFYYEIHNLKVEVFETIEQTILTTSKQRANIKRFKNLDMLQFHPNIWMH